MKVLMSTLRGVSVAGEYDEGGSRHGACPCQFEPELFHHHLKEDFIPLVILA